MRRYSPIFLLLVRIRDSLSERVEDGSRNPADAGLTRFGLCGYLTRNLKIAATTLRVCEILGPALYLGLLLGGVFLLQPRVQSQTLQPGQKLDLLSMEWPRLSATNGYEFVVYQGYYLYAASNWHGAPSIEGPRTVNMLPPNDLNERIGFRE